MAKSFYKCIYRRGTTFGLSSIVHIVFIRQFLVTFLEFIIIVLVVFLCCPYVSYKMGYLAKTTFCSLSDECLRASG